MESEAKRAGGESVLAKLSELMFIEVVRRHLEALPPEQAGWLAGLRDPFVGKALSLMHGGAAHNWTIEELAKEVGLSRSVLAERFADLLGIPPSRQMADADCFGASERRQRQRRDRRGRNRLPI
jgi:transcriptional regulator GlxA family with amidase domain